MKKVVEYTLKITIPSEKSFLRSTIIQCILCEPLQQKNAYPLHHLRLKTLRSKSIGSVDDVKIPKLSVSYFQNFMARCYKCPNFAPCVTNVIHRYLIMPHVASRMQPDRRPWNRQSFIPPVCKTPSRDFFSRLWTTQKFFLHDLI